MTWSLPIPKWLADILNPSAAETTNLQKILERQDANKLRIKLANVRMELLIHGAIQYALTTTDDIDALNMSESINQIIQQCGNRLSREILEEAAMLSARTSGKIEIPVSDNFQKADLAVERPNNKGWIIGFHPTSARQSDVYNRAIDKVARSHGMYGFHQVGQHDAELFQAWEFRGQSEESLKSLIPEIHVEAEAESKMY